MHRDGTVGIISTKGDGNALDGEKGKIVIGVNKQEEHKGAGHVNNWQYYDKYIDFPEKKKDRKAFWATVKKAHPALAIDKEKRTAEQKALLAQAREKIKKRKLGEGSNIVIEKDKIWLRSGEPGKESSEILVDNKSDKKQVGLYSYNQGKQAEQARIAIFQNNGDIKIENDKRSGSIELMSKTQIDLQTTGGPIFLDAGDKKIVFRSDGKFKVIENKNFILIPFLTFF